MTSDFRIPTPLEFDEASHRYTLQGRPMISVTRALSLIRNTEAAAFFTEGGRERGKRVHQMVQYDIEGILDIGAMDDPTLEYYEQWQEFMLRNKFEPILCEQPVYSTSADVAGTLDLYGMLDGQPALIDIKTGVVEEAVAGPQTAGYKHLAMMLGFIPITTRRYVLDLKPNRWRLSDELISKKDNSIFWNAVSCMLYKEGIR